MIVIFIQMFHEVHKSCPPIRIYKAEKLDQQLEIAAKGFCSQSVELNDKGEFVLSKIFLWYQKDFGANEGEMLTTLAQWISDEKLAGKMRESDGSNVTFCDYQWTPNES